MGLSPQQLSAAVAGGLSFLFGNPFICGKLILGSTSLPPSAAGYATILAPIGLQALRSVGALSWHRVCMS
jgi:hypothetical protein